MTASDWWLVVLLCICVAGIGLAGGYFWGFWRGLKIWEPEANAWHKRKAELKADNTRLRNDLARQLNEQFEL